MNKKIFLVLVLLLLLFLGTALAFSNAPANSDNERLRAKIHPKLLELVEKGKAKTLDKEVLDIKMPSGAVVPLGNVSAADSIEIVFSVSDFNALNRIERKISRFGAKVKAKYATGNIVVADAPVRIIKKIAQQYEVQQVWPNFTVTAELDDSVGQINAESVWSKGFNGEGIKIAVLDSGIDAEHEMLKGKVAAEKNFSDSDSSNDVFGHGTHVAGIAAGNSYLKGVAPNAMLLNAKVLNDSGSGSISSLIAGIDWAVSQGADVINFSLGGTFDARGSPLEAAINDAIAQGVVVVAASGNCGNCGSTACNGFSGVTAPGNLPSVITVGAVDASNAKACFSSGENIAGTGIKPDVVAPGVSINSSVPSGYASKSGTSMATPFAAGAAALIKQINQGYSQGEVKALLEQTALDLGAVGKDIGFGSGLIDLKAASEGAPDLGEPNSNPVVPDENYSSVSFANAAFVLTAPDVLEKNEKGAFIVSHNVSPQALSAAETPVDTEIEFVIKDRFGSIISRKFIGPKELTPATAAEFAYEWSSALTGEYIAEAKVYQEGQLLQSMQQQSVKAASAEKYFIVQSPEGIVIDSLNVPTAVEKNQQLDASVSLTNILPATNLFFGIDEHTIALYRSDASTGYLLEDETGNYWGEWHGTPKWEQNIKKFGSHSAGVFTDSDYIDIPSDSLSGLSSGTIELWAYANSFGNLPAPISTQSTNNVYIQLMNDGRAYFEIGGEAVSSQPGAITLGEWHYIAVTWDGAYIKIFVDGAEQGSKASNKSPGTVTDCFIGRYRPLNGFSFNGYIDEVRISNTARQINGLEEINSGESLNAFVEVSFIDSIGNTVGTLKSDNVSVAPEQTLDVVLSKKAELPTDSYSLVAVAHYEDRNAMQSQEINIFVPDALSINSISIPSGVAIDEDILISAEVSNSWSSEVQAMFLAEILSEGETVGTAIKEASVAANSNALVELNWLAETEAGNYSLKLTAFYEDKNTVSQQEFYIIDTGKPEIADIQFKNSLHENEFQAIKAELADQSSINPATIQVSGPNTNLNSEMLWVSGTDSNKTVAFTLSELTQGGYGFEITACDVYGNCTTSNSYSFTVGPAPPECNGKNILVVKDNDGFNSVQNSNEFDWTNHLNNDYCTITWNKKENGSPTLNYLQRFDVVVWSASNRFGPSIEADDEKLLADFMGIGGKLLLEGAEIAFEQSDLNFAKEVMHSFLENDFALDSDNSSLALSSHPVFEGIDSIDLNSSLCPYPDSITIIDGEAIADWNTGGTAAIAYEDDKSKILFYSFSLDAIEDKNTQKKLVENSIKWLNTKTNQAPAINSHSPLNNPTINEGEQQVFSITKSDPDNDALTVEWHVNDSLALSNSDSYTHSTDYNSAGAYAIKAIVSDADLNTSQEWILTVADVPITCFSNNDCPPTSYSENHCSEGNVARDVNSHACIKPGTPDSSCLEQIQVETVETCDFGCSAGQCVPALNVSISPLNSTINSGATQTFTALSVGGTGSYSYSWALPSYSGCTASSSSQKTYSITCNNTEQSQISINVSLTVTSGSQTKTANTALYVNPWPACDSYSYNSCGNAYEISDNETKPDMCGANQYYKITTTQTCDIKWVLTSGNAGYDLYAKYSSNRCPSTSEYDCSPYFGGNVETCVKTQAPAGTYYAMANKKYWSYDSYSIRAELSNCNSDSFPPVKVKSDYLDGYLQSRNGSIYGYSSLVGAGHYGLWYYNWNYIRRGVLEFDIGNIGPVSQATFFLGYWAKSVYGETCSFDLYSTETLGRSINASDWDATVFEKVKDNWFDQTISGDISADVTTAWNNAIKSGRNYLSLRIAMDNEENYTSPTNRCTIYFYDTGQSADPKISYSK